MPGTSSRTAFLKVRDLLESPAGPDALGIGYGLALGDFRRMKMIILAAGLGTRMRAVCGDRPKVLADLGGETILDRLLAVAADARLEPMIVTRPEHAADFRHAPAEVFVEERPAGMLTTLYQVRGLVHEPFVWAAGDMVFCDHEPLRQLVEQHEPDSFASFLYCRSDRFKAKVVFEPELRVVPTREGTWTHSIANFVVQSPRIFSYMQPDPEANFMVPAFAAGERCRFLHYTRKVFEIDTPGDLDEARLCLPACRASSIS